MDGDVGRGRRADDRRRRCGGDREHAGPSFSQRGSIAQARESGVRAIGSRQAVAAASRAAIGSSRGAR